MDETTRLQYARGAAQDFISSNLTDAGNMVVADGITIYRRTAVTDFQHGQSLLALCVIVQGSKEIMLGERVYRYDADNYLTTAEELPIISRIVGATPENPYLGIVIKMDPALIGSVLLGAPRLANSLPPDDQAFAVAEVDHILLDTVVRLLHATQSPDDADFLLPMIRKELVYRLLEREHGSRLARIAGIHPVSRRLSSALELMRTDFDQPLSIPEIAAVAGMSVSSFHEHFKRATGLTPLQFQKHLRLREARRLLLSEDIDVAGAGYQVGYHDSSHFNRDYRKMFGQSPMKDIESIQAAGPLAVTPN